MQISWRRVVAYGAAIFVLVGWTTFVNFMFFTAFISLFK